VNAFGNGMVAALQRPDQAELLRKNSRAITETALRSGTSAQGIESGR